MVKKDKREKKDKEFRRRRFQKLYTKRLEKAETSIKSIGKLSEKTNYIYKEDEVDEILYRLMSVLKSEIVKFGSGSVEDRFKRLMDIDLQQLKQLRTNDHELYKFIVSKQSKGTSAIENYLDERKKEDKLLSLSKAKSDKNLTHLYELSNDVGIKLMEKMSKQIDALTEANKKQRKGLDSKPKHKQIDTKDLQEQIEHLHDLIDRNKELALREIDHIKGNMSLVNNKL